MTPPDLPPGAPVPESIRNRKGARTTRDVPAEVRALLDAGRLETANLCEWLVVDLDVLSRHVLAGLGAGDRHAELARRLADAPPTAPKRHAVVGAFLASELAVGRSFDRVFRHLAGHPSDVVRAWAAELVGRRPGWDVRQRLAAVRRLAADGNMSVREMAWLAVRDAIHDELETAIGELATWTGDPDANVRRFASEATRPRGVWCRHIPALKSDPGRGLPILGPLRADPARYVQDSVGNWLNDASKSRPDWVREVASAWEAESASPATARIVRRGLRTLRRAPGEIPV